jgi:hypothetical protein
MTAHQTEVPGIAKTTRVPKGPRTVFINSGGQHRPSIGDDTRDTQLAILDAFEIERQKAIDSPSPIPY